MKPTKKRRWVRIDLEEGIRQIIALFTIYGGVSYRLASEPLSRTFIEKRLREPKHRVYMVLREMKSRKLVTTVGVGPATKYELNTSKIRKVG